MPFLLWIIGNPLLSGLIAGLIAVIVAVGIWAGFLKIENKVLTHKVSVFVLQDKKRVEIAKATIAANEAKVKADKLRSKKLESDNAKAKLEVAAAYSANRKLLGDIEFLRDSASCGLPEAPADSPIRLGEDPTAFSGSSERLLIELAKAADKLRTQMFTCQEFVKGL